MKKLILIGVMNLLALGLAASCFAGAYIAANFGVSVIEDGDLSSPDYAPPAVVGAELSYDTGIGLSLAVGHALKGVRYEGEVSYFRTDVDEVNGIDSGGNKIVIPLNGDITTTALMANVYKDFDTGTEFRPFVGLGVGAANLDMEINQMSDDDTVFAFQLLLGFGYQVAEKTRFDLSYRFFTTDDPEFYGTSETKYVSSLFLAGLRFDF